MFYCTQHKCDNVQIAIILIAQLKRLCSLKDLKNANILFDTIRVKVPTLDTPLMNFTNFLLQTLQRDAGPLFQTLRQKYSSALSRDPLFNQVRIVNSYQNLFK